MRVLNEEEGRRTALQRDHDEFTTRVRTRGDHRVSRSQRWSDFVRTNDGCVEEMGRQSFVVKIRRRREESRGGFTRVRVCILRRTKYIIFVVRADAVSMEHNTVCSDRMGTFQKQEMEEGTMIFPNR